MNLEISLEDLLKNGSHFGNNKKRWNPKMEKYIYGEKNGTHILDLRKSLPLIEKFLNHPKNKNKSPGPTLLFFNSVCEELAWPKIPISSFSNGSLWQ